MKVYVVIIDYEYRNNGSGMPDSIFLNRDEAEAHAESMNDGYQPPLARVVEMTVADYEETNGYV